ncbi:hypothetical protein ACVWW5_006821 [Bradyrhizobium sp. LM3.4]
MIAKADINLNGDHCLGQLSLQAQVNALVLVIFTHLLDREGGRIKDDAVIGRFDLTDAGEELNDGAGLGVAVAEQVEITGWPEDVFKAKSRTASRP